MKSIHSPFPYLFLFLFSCCHLLADEISTKGALIIASVEGQVTVVNNDTQQPLPASKVIAGGVIYDGHTVKTGPSAKMVLLLTNGTVATIKSESSLNIKKFTQEKFDMSKTNLSELKGEPSKSNVVIDIEIGDMVVDVKKLDKKSSFNIESPVGTAGIRGTVPAISVVQMPDGGFQQKTAMLRGEIAFTPRGGGLPTMLGPGQSLASGIGPNGIMLPMQLGQVSQAMMTAIQADVEAAGAAMGISPEGGVDASDATVPDPDEPSEDELNESDDKRKGASKGVGDDDNGTDAVALEKAGLIDLNDPEQAAKADSFVEVSTLSAGSFAAKGEKEAQIAAQKSELDGDKSQLEQLKLQRNSRRNDDTELSIDEQIAALEAKISVTESDIAISESELGKGTASFVEALSDHMASTVDVIIEAEALGVKSEDLITQTTEYAENAQITNKNLKRVKEAGVTDNDALAGLVSSPDKSDEAEEMLDLAVAEKQDDPETFAALARSTDVADKMMEAKESGTDVDSVLVAIKTTDSKKQVAKQKKVEAQNKKDEALASGVEIPPTLVSSIDAAQDDAELTLLLEENTGTVYYDQLVILKDSRSDIINADAETLAADTAKTKIVDTSAYVRKVKEISVKKLEEANEQKKGLSSVIVADIETQLTIDSTGDDITTLKESYAVDPNYDTIVSFIDKLKSSFDLDPANMASGIVDNAETAADNLETISTAETLGVDPASIAQKPERAKEYKEITTQVADDIESGAVGADLFTNLDTVADIVSVAKDKGLDTTDLTKNVAKDAAVATEMKEFVDQIDASSTTTDSATAFANIADAGNIIKKAKDSGISTEDLAKDLAGDAEVIGEMKEFVDQIDITGTSAETATAFANIADAGNIIKKAKDSGISTDDLAKDLAGDADVIGEMKEFVDQIVTTGTSADSASAFANIADAGRIIKQGKDSGVSTDDLAKNLADNTEAISSMKSASDQLDGLGAEGDAASFFTNIVEVGRAVQKAKDLGVEDEALILEMTKNPDKAAQVNQVFEAVGTGVDADAAKNILGNVDEIGEMADAIVHAEKSGANLNDFVKKDVEEHKALNNVIEQLGGTDGDAAEKFLNEGIDDVLQLNQALEEGHLDADALASSVSSGETFADAFKNSSVDKLKERFGGNDDLLEAVSLYEDQANDILFALSFVDPGSSQETALMGNLDKLGAIMYLSHRFEDNPQRMNIIFSNLDVAIALDQLVAELGVFPGRLSIVFENAELAPAILATYQEYEQNGAYDLIDTLFSSSQSLKDTISNDGLNKLLRDFPGFAFEIETNRERAGEISNLITQVGPQYADHILHNLEKFDDLNTMILRTKGDPFRIETLFYNIHALEQIKKLSDHYKEINLLGGQDVVFLNIELFSQDPLYYELALNSPKFFVRLSEISGDLNDVPSSLAAQLQELNLNREELKTVLADLLAGPQVEGPNTAPPEQTGDQASSDTATLSFLMDHVIPSQDDESIEGVVYLNPNKVVSYDMASTSTFFKESSDLYFMLSDLDSSDDPDNYANTTSLQDAGYFVGGVFGGRNIEFNSATYNLSNLNSENLLVAAGGTLSLKGEIDIITKSGIDIVSELIFMSLEQLSIAEGSSINYGGETLGFGSLETIDVINVDLFAEGEISLRSLDSLVINDSSMATSGKGGADFVHLLAASELSIDNLRFSEHVRQIAMEAMTINLSNLNFPAGSTVQLNSLYGGVDGVYPNFGNKEYGRVNFIQNVRYNQNLMNSRSTFDQFGGSITIGNSQ